MEGLHTDLPVFHLVIANYYKGFHIFQRRHGSQLKVDTLPRRVRNKQQRSPTQKP